MDQKTEKIVASIGRFAVSPLFSNRDIELMVRNQDRSEDFLSRIAEVLRKVRPEVAEILTVS